MARAMSSGDTRPPTPQDLRASADRIIQEGPWRFSRLARYLAEKAPRGMLPGRQHIDPSEIPELLPCLALFEIIRPDAGRLRYRIRLAGTEVVGLHGAEITGKYLDEVLTGTGGAEILHSYADIVAQRRPHYRSGYLEVTGRSHVAYERVIFPLARDGVTVDMLLAAINPKIA